METAELGGRARQEDEGSGTGTVDRCLVVSAVGVIHGIVAVSVARELALDEGAAAQTPGGADDCRHEGFFENTFGLELGDTADTELVVFGLFVWTNVVGF